MSSSCCSSRTSSSSCSCPKKEAEVTLDDVATVLADLNSKVLQLRKEIIALKDCPISAKSKGRARNDSEEPVRKKLATRKAFQRKEEYVRRKIRSLIRKKPSKTKDEWDESSSTSHRSQAIQTIKQRPAVDKEEYRNVAFSPYIQPESEEVPIKSSKKNRSAKSNDENLRKKTREEKKRRDLAIENWSQDSSDSDRSKSKDDKIGKFSNKKRDTSVSERKNKSVRRYSSPLENSHRITNESEKTSAERSTLLYSKSGQSNDSRKHLRERQNGRIGVNKMVDNWKKSKREDDTEAIIKHGNNRIVLPSRVSTKCQGIRHAFGLSNLYCDCHNLENKNRRVQIKKISRGVQCDPPKNNKCKRYCGLGVCFGFKGCTKKSRKRNSRNSMKVGKSTESFEIYKPKEKRSANVCVRDKNDFYQICHSEESKNRRMSGGTDENYVRNFEIARNLPPRNFEEYRDAQRHRNVARHKNETPDRLINKNNVKHVKLRLNACLLELNDIIDYVKP